MIYTSPVYAIIASLLVGQLLFPYQWREHITWPELLPHSNEKVAGDLPDDIAVGKPFNRQRAVRTRSRRNGSGRYYPRLLASVPAPGRETDPSASSRIAKHLGNDIKLTGTDELERQTDIETANAEEPTSPQIRVPPPKIPKDCVSDVQAQPTCNNVHERSMDDALIEQSLQTIHFGGTRNVWRVFEQLNDGVADGKVSSTSSPPSYALKTLRWKRSFDEQTYRLQEKEAVALDYLTGASGVVAVHGYCATTLQSEYANRDTLSAFLKKSRGRTHQIVPIQLLQIAWRLAQGVANMSRKGGGLRIVHRDLDASNIMLTKNNTDGTWDVRLDDFNQAYIMNYRDSNGEVCSYQEAFVCGEDGRRVDVRAPEECLDIIASRPSLSEKVDVYGLGTVLYYILTHRRAFNLDHDAPGPAKEYPDWYRKRVTEGGRPQLPESITSDEDGAVQSIVEAMKMAMTKDADARVHAQVIADYLLEQLRAYVREQKYSYAKGKRLHEQS